MCVEMFLQGCVYYTFHIWSRVLCLRGCFHLKGFPSFPSKVPNARPRKAFPAFCGQCSIEVVHLTVEHRLRRVRSIQEGLASLPPTSHITSLRQAPIVSSQWPTPLLLAKLHQRNQNKVTPSLTYSINTFTECLHCVRLQRQFDKWMLM